MTTIAYRAGVLAGDTLASRGLTAYRMAMTKVSQGLDGRMGAACGSASFCEAWKAWITGQSDERPEPRSEGDECDTGLLVRPDGRVEIHEAGGFWVFEGEYYAVGSGRDQALGAMHAGASAEAAVEAAMAHDVYSGGRCVAVRWKAAI